MSSLNSYLKEIRNFNLLTKKEETELFLKAKAGDKKAYEQIITSNLRFVISVAKKYQIPGVELDDLIAEGNMGLLKAYEKFDVNKKLKFITYAVWWIKQSIINYINDYSKLIRLPMNKVINLNKINKIKDSLEQKKSREVSYEELVDIVDNPDILNDLKHNCSIISLEKPQTDNQKDLNEILPDPVYHISNDLVYLKEEIEDILKEFSPKERKILKMYYGIGYERSYTLKEIGEEFKLTRERIRQIKQKAIEKLRNKKHSNRLKN